MIKKVIEFIIKNKIKQYTNTKVWNLFKQEFNKNFFYIIKFRYEGKKLIFHM